MMSGSIEFTLWPNQSSGIHLRGGCCAVQNIMSLAKECREAKLASLGGGRTAPGKKVIFLKEEE